MFDFFNILRWQDVLDIVIVAFVFAKLIVFIRGTRSAQMLLGVVVLTVVYFLASVLDLMTVQWLVRFFFSSLLIIIVIVFQQDIRRVLMQVGQTPFQKNVNIEEKNIDEIVRSVGYLSKRRIGALIVIERETGLRDFIESGVNIEAELTKELLVSIFMPVSPLHDGGVIIKNGEIHSASCVLPLSQNPYIKKKFGTRHRAAIGLSEETDAVVVVVSEETQEISLIQHGALTIVPDEVTLAGNLREILISKEEHLHPWKNWIYKK